MKTRGDPSGLARLLRHTRTRLRISQMELALRLGVSQRHVSYLETERSRPSRTLLLAWMKAVDAPASVRNAALLQAGFAVAGRPAREDDTDLAELGRALRQVIDAHHPFPAFVFDIDRTMLEVNRGAEWMWSLLMPGYWAEVQARGERIDMIDALVHPGGLFHCMRNPHAAGLTFLGLLRAEEWVRPTLRPRVDALAKALSQCYGDAPGDHGTGLGKPQLNFVFDTEYGPLAFILVQSVFGLPQDITSDSPRIELWFPADGLTRQAVLEHAPRRGEDGKGSAPPR